MAIISEFDCWYDNGLAAAQWKADKNDHLVKDCTLQLTEEKLVLVGSKRNVSCPWPGVDINTTPSNRGNAVLDVTFKGDNGGTAKIVLPGYSPNAFWAELWRVAPPMRARMEPLRPETLPVSASVQVQLDYLGGYPLDPKKSFGGVWIAMHQYGVAVGTGIRQQGRMFLPWRDVADISLEGMLDQQRQRSLARTVEFGALGGLAGKNVKSAYLTVTTGIGAAVFHTQKMTVPELPNSPRCLRRRRQ